MNPHVSHPGDYTMVHSDGTDLRRLSYVLHVTRDWDPKFGGDLVFLDPMRVGQRPSSPRLASPRLSSRELTPTLGTTSTPRSTP